MAEGGGFLEKIKKMTHIEKARANKEAGGLENPPTTEGIEVRHVQEPMRAETHLQPEEDVEALERAAKAFEGSRAIDKEAA